MKVKVQQDCFIDGSRFRAGAVIEYGGPITKWMEPVEEQSPASAVELPRIRRKREDKDASML